MTTPAGKIRQVLELAAAGASDSVIGLALGVHARTVLRIRQRHNVPSSWRPTRTAACGSPGAYRRGCRCQVCRAGHAARTRAAKASRRERLATGTATFKHGSSAYRNWGCRCETCRNENAATHKAWRTRRAAR